MPPMMPCRPSCGLNLLAKKNKSTKFKNKNFEKSDCGIEIPQIL